MYQWNLTKITDLSSQVEKEWYLYAFYLLCKICSNLLEGTLIELYDQQIWIKVKKITKASKLDYHLSYSRCDFYLQLISWFLGEVNSGSNMKLMSIKTAGASMKSHDKNSLLWPYCIGLCQTKPEKAWWPTLHRKGASTVAHAPCDAVTLEISLVTKTHYCHLNRQ